MAQRAQVDVRHTKDKVAGVTKRVAQSVYLTNSSCRMYVLEDGAV